MPDNAKLLQKTIDNRPVEKKVKLGATTSKTQLGRNPVELPVIDRDLIPRVVTKEPAVDQPVVEPEPVEETVKPLAKPPIVLPRLLALSNIFCEISFRFFKIIFESQFSPFYHRNLNQYLLQWHHRHRKLVKSQENRLLSLKEHVLFLMNFSKFHLSNIYSTESRCNQQLWSVSSRCRTADLATGCTKSTTGHELPVKIREN